MDRVVLIFPPQGDPTLPAQPLACLQAYLKQQFDDLKVLVIDANVEAYEYILDKNRLANLHRRVQKKCQELEDKANLNNSQREYYCSLAKTEISAPYVIDSIDSAKAVLRDKEAFYDYEQYFFASSIVTRALRFVSAAYYPTTLEIGGFSLPYSIERLSDLLAAMEDDGLNPFRHYYEERLLPKISRYAPALIGISMSYPTQIHQTLYLARMFHERFPHVPIVVGGSMTPFIAKGLASAAPLFQWISYFVTHEGEISLAELINALRSNADISRVPGIVYKEGDQIKYSGSQELPKDLNTLPLPDFSGFPFNLYLSPETVLPYSLGRGCYWKKCAFCCQDLVSRNHPRMKSPETIRRELKLFKKEYNVSRLFISDEGFDAESLAIVGDIIAEEELNISWCSDARLENSWSKQRFSRAARGGCIKLWFGLESYNQRILNKINKGIKKSRILSIINDCRRTGILVHLYCMFSFPGETFEEACRTVKFIAENQSLIDTVAFNVFRLHSFSKISQMPEKYSVTLLPVPCPEEFQQDIPFETTEGMTRNEAIALCKSIQTHPSMEPFLAPYVLSKAHILLLGTKDRRYRDHIIQAANKIHQHRKITSCALGKKAMLRLPEYVNISSFICDPFRSENDNGHTIYAYIPWQDRHVSMSEHMGKIILAFSEGKTVQEAGQVLQVTDWSGFVTQVQMLLNEGLLEQ